MFWTKTRISIVIFKQMLFYIFVIRQALALNVGTIGAFIVNRLIRMNTHPFQGLKDVV
jgi:hypothetical protein